MIRARPEPEGGKAAPGPGALRRLVLRAAAGPLRRPALLLYGLTARAVTRVLRAVAPGATVYATRSFAARDLIPAVSDLDLVVVVDASGTPGSGRKRAKRRWRSMAARLPPPVRRAVGDVGFYEPAELRSALSGSVLEADRAVVFGERPPGDDFGLIVRPGSGGPDGWRLMGGPERRPAPVPTAHHLAIWLELQFHWAHAFRAALEPAMPWAALAWAKLVAEPAKILLSLDGLLVSSRDAALSEGARRMPELAPGLDRARDLLGSIGRCPSAPVADLLPTALSLTRAIVAALEPGAGHSRTEVMLVDSGERRAPGRSFPLADWRAVAIPSLPDELLWLADAEPLSPKLIAPRLPALARAAMPGSVPALRAEGLLLLPCRDFWRAGMLRSVQCPLTDPVSFALLDGADRALFPSLRGWSAADWARRAVAEHRAWLARPEAQRRGNPRRREWSDGSGEGVPGALRALSKLLTAARAGLFHRSLAEGRPRLCVTMEATARELGGESSDAADAAYRAYTAMRRPRGAEGGDTTAGYDGAIDAARHLEPHVRRLPAYAEPVTGE